MHSKVANSVDKNSTSYSKSSATDEISLSAYDQMLESRVSPDNIDSFLAEDQLSNPEMVDSSPTESIEPLETSYPKPTRGGDDARKSLMDCVNSYGMGNNCDPVDTRNVKPRMGGMGGKEWDTKTTIPNGISSNTDVQSLTQTTNQRPNEVDMINHNNENYSMLINVPNDQNYYQ